MKRLLCILIILIIAGCLFYQFKRSVAPGSLAQEPHIKINHQIIKVEIADERGEWRQGLSDRAILEENIGMLFIFPVKQVRSFWMKNMHFPIDIIWIEDNKVVYISRNLSPEGEHPKRTYSSVLPVNYVLEVNAGMAKGWGIEVGNRVVFGL